MALLSPFGVLGPMSLRDCQKTASKVEMYFIFNSHSLNFLPKRVDHS